jgi:glycosyltransferase involved in cell wall biosynthesis
MKNVTVIIPNYNHAPYLEQRIQSVLDQSYQDFEMILLDDYSTDSSKEIINKYVGNDKIAHVFFNEKNSGSPFGLWKYGIEKASGKYIWIAESDDWAEGNHLEPCQKWGTAYLEATKEILK